MKIKSETTGKPRYWLTLKLKSLTREFSNYHYYYFLMAPKSGGGGGGAKAPSAHPSRGPCLVDDQVAYLRRNEVRVASISSCTEEKAILIEKVKVSVVFGSPEVWIKNERRRAMLGNSLSDLFIQINHVLWPSTKPT